MKREEGKTKLQTKIQKSILYSEVSFQEFIQEKYAMNLKYDLRLNCKVTQKGFRDKLLKDLYILKKNHSLKFYIEHHNVPGVYSVKWKVRNCIIFSATVQNK